MSENKETHKILDIEDNIVRGDFDLFRIIEKCGNVYNICRGEFVDIFVHSFYVPGGHIMHVNPNYDIRYIPYKYYHGKQYVQASDMLKMIYGAIVFDKTYPFYEDVNIETAREAAKILTDEDDNSYHNDLLINNITRIAGTADGLVSRLCVFVRKYGKGSHLKFNMSYVSHIHEFYKFLFMNKIIKEELSPEEKEEVVMQYFGMERREELAALLQSTMRKIKNEYEAKVKGMNMVLNLNGEFMDVNELHGRNDELDQLMKRYEFIERLHDSVNAHIEHPDALP